jgi:probable H4MPT-linked C1 transfer pathway protein
MPATEVFGWDVGGAHVKACRLGAGGVLDVVQWACPLWQGLDHLDRLLATAQQRWPQLPQATHAVTMTGEMVDLFTDREDGVQRIAARLAQRLAPAELHFYAGDEGWCGSGEAADRWDAIASANWLATAKHAALARPDDAGVLIDIGSTTTDLIAFRDGTVLTTSRSDADRLASGELVYQGVVRTPLCALAPRIGWRGRPLNVMNEFFATVADVYRLTGELDPAHDLQASADNAGKDLAATRRRLARMIGLDARDGSAKEWLDFARAWRACQLQEIGGQLRRVLALHELGPGSRVVSAGCGDFLVPELCTLGGLDHAIAYGTQVARLAPAAPDAAALAAWAQVCAPCIAVATLLRREADRCGS